MAHPATGKISSGVARRLAWRFGIAGAAIGFVIGLVEAGLFYWIPRATGLVRPDVEYVIWFLAPALDLASGALLGVILGSAAGAIAWRRPAATGSFFAALGLGLAGAYLAWLLDWFRIGAGVVFPERLVARTPVEWFLIVFVVAFVLMLALGRGASLLQGALPPRRGRWLAVFLIVIAASIGGVVFYATHRPFSGAAGAPSSSPGTAQSSRPNVVLMVLDTVRADHLSCYGYTRPTTPNFDQLAARGALFEDALAPSSWTLPSMASILTGLMPHQSGADWGQALDPAPWTLARILASKGYETAGFNANPFYGLAGWRLSEGFSVYEDDAYAIRHNLAVTFVGQSVLRWLYERLVRYNQFDRRDARDVDRDVERWARRRDPSKPYFLFINYMDAHRPYLPPAPFDRRFGRIPSGLLSRLTQPLVDGRPRRPYTPEDRVDQVAGYDNSLAYLDLQAGRLIDFLKRQPGGGDTLLIITSDHGEGFGEHGAYDHGWNLYAEVLRVPLIIAGPGVPAGARVTAPVPNREIFSTVLDLALGLKGAVALSTLRNDWSAESHLAQSAYTSHRENGAGLRLSAPAEGGRAGKPGSSQDRGAPRAGADGVLSELNIFSQGADPAALSLATPEWRLILNSSGEPELYDRRKDPEETRNEAADPQWRDTLMKLESALEARVAYSLLPWRALDYLSPLNQPGQTFIDRIIRGGLKFPAERLPIGSAQAMFSGQPPSQLVRPPRPEEEVLRTLPYH